MMVSCLDYILEDVACAAYKSNLVFLKCTELLVEVKKLIAQTEDPKDKQRLRGLGMYTFYALR